MMKEELCMSDLRVNSWVISEDCGYVQITDLGILGGDWVEVLQPFMSISRIYSRSQSTWGRLGGIELDESFLIDRLGFTRFSEGDPLVKHGEDYSIIFNSGFFDINNLDGRGVEHYYAKYLHQLQSIALDFGVDMMGDILLLQRSEGD